MFFDGTQTKHVRVVLFRSFVYTNVCHVHEVLPMNGHGYIHLIVFFFLCLWKNKESRYLLQHHR